jgi:hypothetical protein
VRYVAVGAHFSNIAVLIGKGTIFLHVTASAHITLGNPLQHSGLG